MNYRSDKYGNQISVLGFGCMRFPRKNGAIDMAETERELVCAVEQGINYFDTAYICLALRSCFSFSSSSTRWPVLRAVSSTAAS